MLKQIKDIAIIKTAAENSDFLLMQNPITGETYRITKTNLLSGFSSINTLILDGVTNVISARSTRKLLSSYTGNALEIQLVSGGATQNIGFAGENLNTASITSFVSSNSAYVTKLYDQIGINIASQPTFSLCPKIVDSGTIITAGNKPTLSYSGNFLSSAIPSAYPITIIAAIRVPAPTKGAFIKCGGGTTGIGIGIGIGTVDSIGSNLIGLNEGIAWIPSSRAISNSQMAIVEINSTGSSTNIYLNGELAASGGNSNSASGTYNIGGYTGRFPTCSISEDIVFNQIISPVTRAKVVANMMNYYNIT